MKFLFVVLALLLTSSTALAGNLQDPPPCQAQHGYADMGGTLGQIQLDLLCHPATHSFIALQPGDSRLFTVDLGAFRHKAQLPADEALEFLVFMVLYAGEGDVDIYAFRDGDWSGRFVDGDFSHAFQADESVHVILQADPSGDVFAFVVAWARDAAAELYLELVALQPLQDYDFLRGSFGAIAAPQAPEPTALPAAPAGEEARVLRVIDGDTIEVSLNRRNHRVRYIGINTPERDEACSNTATAANRRLVGGRTVTLVSDAEDTDRYGRLLRYIYADGVFVNEALVRDGFAENSVWPPNTRHADRFRALEAEARAAGRGCHPSGVFDDGDTER